MKLINMVCATCLVTTISSSAALADDDDPMLKAIEARKAIMTNYSWNAGPLFGMAKGKIEYNAETASALANNLKLLSMLNNGSQWPAGSDSDAYPDDTRSLPEIWSTYPEIGEKGEAFDKAAAELAAVAGDGLDALKSKIGALGKSCKGCHDDFRAEDD